MSQMCVYGILMLGIIIHTKIIKGLYNEAGQLTRRRITDRKEDWRKRETESKASFGKLLLYHFS